VGRAELEWYCKFVKGLVTKELPLCVEKFIRQGGIVLSKGTLRSRRGGFGVRF